MSKREPLTDMQSTELQMDLSHLRRESRTALELALVAMAPSELVDGLAAAAGLLEALSELPRGTPLMQALVPKVVTRTRTTLDAWQKWHQEHLEKKLPRG